MAKGAVSGVRIVYHCPVLPFDFLKFVSFSVLRGGRYSRSVIMSKAQWQTLAAAVEYVGGWEEFQQRIDKDLAQP